MVEGRQLSAEQQTFLATLDQDLRRFNTFFNSTEC
ncbi:hypothetical protein HaLaN_00365 [Haematococcus lacustris]|uniref:Uncharacterized protein n=1 Tax=Haematococcus lacustris TaxID=44745 RepID=A0A699YFM0_HAELA|nr:hypothetical protein HaLaN_00365 [Haematococcus lacustris]